MQLKQKLFILFGVIHEEIKNALRAAYIAVPERSACQNKPETRVPENEKTIYFPLSINGKVEFLCLNAHNWEHASLNLPQMNDHMTFALVGINETLLCIKMFAEMI